MFKYLARKGPKSCNFLSNDSPKKRVAAQMNGWTDGWIER